MLTPTEQQELDELQRQLPGEKENIAELKALLGTVGNRAPIEAAIKTAEAQVRATEQRIRTLKAKQRSGGN